MYKTKDEMINELTDYWLDLIEYNELIAFYREKQLEELKKLSLNEVKKSYRQNILGEE